MTTWWPPHHANTRSIYIHPRHSKRCLLTLTWEGVTAGALGACEKGDLPVWYLKLRLIHHSIIQYKPIYLSTYLVRRWILFFPRASQRPSQDAGSPEEGGGRKKEEEGQRRKDKWIWGKRRKDEEGRRIKRGRIRGKNEGKGSFKQSKHLLQPINKHVPLWSVVAWSSPWFAAAAASSPPCAHASLVSKPYNISF